MTTQPSPTPPEYTLGVLFVHGLGEHTRGAALTHWGKALIQCIDNWIEGGKPSGTPLHQLVNVTMADASVEPIDSARQDPPFAVVEFNTPSPIPDDKAMRAHLNNQQWLLAESHWDSSYPPPTYAELLIWSVAALPWTILTHVNKTLRRAEYGLQEGTSGYRRLVGAYMLLLVTLMLSPQILFVVVLLSVLGALPLPYVGTLVAAAQRGLANTVGDSYVLVGNPISGEVIYSRLLRDLKWLHDNGCQRVAVVAHSQGAAVAHRVIKSHSSKPEVEQVELLVTLGQGLSKLNSIAHSGGAEAIAYMWGAIVSILAVALASVDLIFNLRFTAGKFASSTADVLTVDVFDGIGILVWSGTLVGSSLLVVVIRYAERAQKFTIPLWLNWIGLILIGVIVVGYGFFALRSGWDVSLNAPVRLIVGTIVVLGVLCSHIFMLFWEKANHKELSRTQQLAIDEQEFSANYQLGIPWHDYFTRKDLVPNGPLFDSYDPKSNSSFAHFMPIEIFNKGNWVSDHSWYWENIEEFVYPVSHALVGLSAEQPPSAYLPNKDKDPLTSSINARTRRVKWLILGNWLLIAGHGIAAALLLNRYMGSLHLPAFLTTLTNFTLTVVNVTLLPSLLRGLIMPIVGNEAAAMLFAQWITLLFLCFVWRLVIHIGWMIRHERPGRLKFYEDLQENQASPLA